MFGLGRVFAKRRRAHRAADCDVASVPMRQVSFGAAVDIIRKMQRKLRPTTAADAEAEEAADVEEAAHAEDAAPPPQVDKVAVEVNVHHFAHNMRRTTTYRNKQKREAEEVRMP
jgi:hypothetical protein